MAVPFQGRLSNMHSLCTLAQRPNLTVKLHHVLLQVYFPQQGVCIAFSPSGVRAPQRATQGQPGRAPAAAEPYSEEAFNFTRHHCLQREVTPAFHFKSLFTVITCYSFLSLQALLWFTPDCGCSLSTLAVHTPLSLLTRIVN